MYHVVQQGRIVYSGALFVDAWCYVKLHSNIYCIIRGPDGTWVVNPGMGN